MAIGQIIGIMSDQAMSGGAARWDVDHLIELETRLGIVPGGADAFRPGDPDAEADIDVTLGIDDVATLLDGMAYTEMASADFPWIDMVRWTSDFVAGELRQHWTDDEWLGVAGDRP